MFAARLDTNDRSCAIRALLPMSGSLDNVERRPDTESCSSAPSGTSSHLKFLRRDDAAAARPTERGFRRRGRTWKAPSHAAHVAHGLLAYAGQIAAQPGSAYLRFDLVIHADAPPRDVLQVVIASGRLLSSALARHVELHQPQHERGSVLPEGAADMQRCISR